MNQLKLSFLFCLLLLLNACQDKANKSADFTDYHRQIMEAESLIAKEAYGKSLEVYEAVFSNYDFVFLRDYQIASQLALYLGEKEIALNYIKKGIASGWKLDTLKKNKFIIAHLEVDQWKKLEDEYNNLNGQFLKRIDLKIRAKVESMFNDDQRIAKAAAQIEDEKKQEEFIVEKFPLHSEKQIEKLIKILDTYGYPGEFLIGNDFWVSTILSHHNSISEDYVKRDTLFPFIQPKLLLALKKGQISPYELALMEDWKKAVISDGEEPNYGYLNSPNQFNLAKVNELRKKNGLRSVELRNKLVDIGQTTGMSFYLPDWVEGKIAIEKK